MSIVQSLYCAPPPHHLLLPSLEAPGTGGTEWWLGGGGGGGGVVKARQVIPLQARQDWNSDLPAGCALHCNVEAVEDGGGCALELWWMCSSDRWKGLRLSLNPSPAYKPILLLVTLLQFPLSFLRLEVAQKRESLVA